MPCSGNFRFLWSRIPRLRSESWTRTDTAIRTGVITGLTEMPIWEAASWQVGSWSQYLWWSWHWSFRTCRLWNFEKPVCSVCLQKWPRSSGAEVWSWQLWCLIHWRSKRYIMAPMDWLVYWQIILVWELRQMVRPCSWSGWPGLLTHWAGTGWWQWRCLILHIRSVPWRNGGCWSVVSEKSRHGA